MTVLLHSINIQSLVRSEVVQSTLLKSLMGVSFLNVQYFKLKTIRVLRKLQQIIRIETKVLPVSRWKF